MKSRRDLSGCLVLCCAVGAALSGASVARAQSVVQGPIVNPANGHTYYRLSNSNWSAAEAAAVALGGHLVSINDDAENTFVLTNFANAAGSGRVWLGLNDAAVEGTYVYTNGDAFSYSNWDPGEPNNANNEDYILMYSGNGRWADVQDLANPPGIGNVYGVVEVSTPACPAISVVQGPIVNPDNGHTYYLLSNSNASCAESYAVANLGGHLVSIQDAAENSFVLNNFANAGGSGRVWLGLNDVASEGTFVYTNGDPVSYTNWDPGEPNNVNNEDYVLMYSGNGRWADVQDLANPPGIGNVYGVVEVPTAPHCVADVDDGSGTGTPDGGVTIDDLLYYLDIFSQGLVSADVDDGSGTGTHDGGVTIDDLLYYLFRFSAGC